METIFVFDQDDKKKMFNCNWVGETVCCRDKHFGRIKSKINEINHICRQWLFIIKITGSKIHEKMYEDTERL